MIYYYFVSYNYTLPNRSFGFGRTEVPRPEPIQEMGQITEIEKYLCRSVAVEYQQPNAYVVVISYQLMRMDSTSPVSPTQQWLTGQEYQVGV